MNPADAANDLLKPMTELRREFHRHPELGFQEQWTQRRIETELDRLGIQDRRVVAKTGIVARIRSGKPGLAIALRADMDALPLTEQNECEFVSEHDGRMHACGHDAHLAMLLGAAEVLQHHRERLPRDVVLLFQPSEERLPGGASAMIAEGALEAVAEVYGLHVLSLMPTGLLATRKGPLMASPSDLEITVRGVGGHAAIPQLAVDPIMLASELVVRLQSTMTRTVDPINPSVLTISSIHGGTTYNVIPDEVKLMGTLRTMSDDLREELLERIQRIAEGVVEPAGGRVDVRILRGYPVLKNHPDATEWVQQRAAQLFGSDAIHFPCEPMMGAEDFSYFLQERPGSFVFLGCGGTAPSAKTPSNHHPQFFVDEACLAAGTGLLSHLAMSPSHVAPGKGE